MRHSGSFIVRVRILESQPAVHGLLIWTFEWSRQCVQCTCWWRPWGGSSSSNKGMDLERPAVQTEQRAYKLSLQRSLWSAPWISARWWSDTYRDAPRQEQTFRNHAQHLGSQQSLYTHSEAMKLHREEERGTYSAMREVITNTWGGHNEKKSFSCSWWWKLSVVRCRWGYWSYRVHP